jgi:hypothetical protein
MLYVKKHIKDLYGKGSNVSSGFSATSTGIRPNGAL